MFVPVEEKIILQEYSYAITLGGTVAHPAVVLAEGDVAHPMQGVCDAPVPADIDQR